MCLCGHVVQAVVNPPFKGHQIRDRKQAEAVFFGVERIERQGAVHVCDKDINCSRCKDRLLHDPVAGIAPPEDIIRLPALDHLLSGLDIRDDADALCPPCCLCLLLPRRVACRLDEGKAEEGLMPVRENVHVIRVEHPPEVDLHRVGFGDPEEHILQVFADDLALVCHRHREPHRLEGEAHIRTVHIRET